MTDSNKKATLTAIVITHHYYNTLRAISKTSWATYNRINEIAMQFEREHAHVKDGEWDILAEAKGVTDWEEVVIQYVADKHILPKP